MKFSELKLADLFCFVGHSVEMKMKIATDAYFSFGINKCISIKDGNFGPYHEESDVVPLGSIAFLNHELHIYDPTLSHITKIPLTNHIPLRAGMKFIDDGGNIYHIDQIDSGIFKLMCHQSYNRVLDEKFSENNTVEDVIKAYTLYAIRGPLKFYTGK